MAKQSQAPTVLLTRPMAASVRFAAGLGDWRVVVSPLQAIVPVAAERPAGDFVAVLFTSENAIEAVRGLGWDLPKRALCVGDRTAEAARLAGFKAESAQGDAGDLGRLVAQSGLSGPFLHPHGREVRRDFAAEGLPVQGVVVYQTESRAWTDEARALLGEDQPVVAPVFSPASAGLLMAARGNLPAPLWFVAMSEAVAQALVLRAGDRIAMSERPDGAAMRAAMERLLSGGVGQG